MTYEFIYNLGEDASGGGGGAKVSFPEYPAEEPGKEAIVAWLDTWGQDLTTSGFWRDCAQADPVRHQEARRSPAHHGGWVGALSFVARGVLWVRWPVSGQ